jgi:hypothetical protein
MRYWLVILSVSLLTFLTACTSSMEADPTRVLSEPQDVVLTEESSLDHQTDRQSVSQTEHPYSEPTLEATISSPTGAPIVIQTKAITPTVMPDPTITSTSFPSPSPTQAPIKASTPTELPTQTPLPQPGVVGGQILFHGAPPSRPVTLILEDHEYRVIQEITILNGEYRFENLPASSEGYNVLFAQEQNSQFSAYEVVSWAWLGPIPVKDGDRLHLPAMEIALVGLMPVNPPDGAIISASSITPHNTLVFEWDPFPSASHYWVDLRVGPVLQLVWQSDYVDSPAVSFDGVLMNGEMIQPNSYWWSVGARLEGGLITIAAPLTSLMVKP